MPFEAPLKCYPVKFCDKSELYVGSYLVVQLYGLTCMQHLGHVIPVSLSMGLFYQERKILRAVLPYTLDRFLSYRRPGDFCHAGHF